MKLLYDRLREDDKEAIEIYTFMTRYKENTFEYNVDVLNSLRYKSVAISPQDIMANSSTQSIVIREGI